MAATYSLIAWGGRTGKTVTLTIASPCVVTCNSHGLKSGTGVRFKANGDTLPTGLTAGVTYYSKWVTSNTFNLYTDAGLTSIVGTSGSQSGTHILRNLLVADPATALAPYGLTDLSRWGASGSERIYDGLTSWNTARAGGYSAFNEEICELGMAMYEYIGSGITISFGAPKTTVHPYINGKITPAFHGGVFGGGFCIQHGYAYAAIQLNFYNQTLDGFSIEVGSYSNGAGVLLNKVNTACKRLMMRCTVASPTGIGIYLSQTNTSAYSNVIAGFGYGIQSGRYTMNMRVYNNTVVKNASYGFYIQYGATEIYGYWYNNIALGNGTNWFTEYSSIEGASKNFGAAGDANPPWAVWGGTAGAVATTDFVNWGGSTPATTDNYRPALLTSPQVSAGVVLYDSLTTDVAGNDAPAYNNGGAEYLDVGAYEFDLGYGPHPASTTVTFTGVNSGTEIRVYDKVTGTELAGIESCATDQALTWVLSGNDTTIRLVNTAYKIKEFDYTPVVGNQSLPIQQEPDKWYSNPI